MKTVLVLARMLSAVFRPAYYPTVGMFILLTMTYLNLLPMGFKLTVLVLTYVFTLALPALGVWLYRKAFRLSRYDLRRQHRRTVPYAIHLLCYGGCMYVMTSFHLPRFMVAVVTVSLLIQVSCVVANVWHKVSMHSAGAGGVTGALLAYSALFGFNPTWWLCGALLLCGLVMTSRMLLRQHSLGQVAGGALIGVLCGMAGVLL